MNILITGYAGFIAKHVTTKLCEMGERPMLGADCFEPRVHRSIALGTSPEARRCAEIPGWLLAEADVIVHLAAQVGVADSMETPLRYMYDNTLDTARFLANLTFRVKEMSSARPLRRLVVASSMSVYGDPVTSMPIDEDWPVRPASVYGLTKYDQERLCLLWGAQHDVSVVALRYFNVYGPGQALHNPYTGVLANFTNAYLHDEAPQVYEDGEQTRDFIYVDDVAVATALAATHLRALGGVYNIATGQPTSILRAANALGQVLGAQRAPIVTGTRRIGDIRHCIGNSERFALAYDWHPRWPFALGIKEYAAWLSSTYGTAPHESGVSCVPTR